MVTLPLPRVVAAGHAAPANRAGPPTLSQRAAGPGRRWTINGDFVALQPTGVARYAREVTLALDALVAEGHPLTRGLEIDLVTPGPGRQPLPLAAIAIRDRARVPQPAAAAVLGAGAAALARARRAPQLLQPGPGHGPPADRLHPRPAHPADARELRARLPLGAPGGAAAGGPARRPHHHRVAALARPPRRLRHRAGGAHHRHLQRQRPCPALGRRAGRPFPPAPGPTCSASAAARSTRTSS